MEIDFSGGGEPLLHPNLADWIAEAKQAGCKAGFLTNGSLLDEVASFYESEVDYDLKNLSAAIEPILLVAIGIMVLVLALGVFLPMWDMVSVYLG